MLLSGGLVLGQAISSSGLLAIMANRLAELVENSNEWVVLMVISALVSQICSLLHLLYGCLETSFHIPWLRLSYFQYFSMNIYK